MFEKRLRIFLAILLVITAAMLVRAAQLQVFGGDHWRRQAADSMKRTRLIETTRGAILDAKNRPIAIDEACQDAAVDFRALVEPPDPAWLRAQAVARLRRELGDAYATLSTTERTRRLAEATKGVTRDIAEMWNVLAKESGQPIEQIEEARRTIVERVQMRRRYVWYHKYRKAVDKEKGVTAPWYSRWLTQSEGDGPELDNFVEDVGEQEAAHPILRDIGNDTYVGLRKSLHKYPGLTLMNSTDRRYPAGNVASHVVGRLSKVLQKDIEKDPNLGRDELREYQKNDPIGRMGLEALCEPALRGVRGRVIRAVGEVTEVSHIDAIPGADVQTTLDVALQGDIEALFKKVQVKNHPIGAQEAVIETLEMHGAAVVIDVPTGAVRALASWPNYDANRYDVDYARLADDYVNQPLVSRATQWAIEPGSTIKPIVGLGAIADGLCGVNDGIECTGYMIVGGKRHRTNRCWVASQFAAKYPELVAHHALPSHAPHRGHSGNLDGFLSFSDALERSCNVYFASLAGRLKFSGLQKWFGAFGLGRPTGIGIDEASGRIPSAEGLSRALLSGETWFAGIGQGQVGATAVQMANVAATLGRGGVWMRPHLVSPQTPTTRPRFLRADGPDVVDLNLPPEALEATLKGMIDVVHKPGGTGNQIARPDITIAGKTGSATASPFRTPQRDAKGAIIYDHVEKTNARGETKTFKCIRWKSYEPASPFNPSAEIPWYRGFGEAGRTISHAWFIGYAPAEKPQIAFAVMVEYGGSGGFAAASVVNPLIDACVKHGYLKVTPDTIAAAQAAAR